MDVYWLYFIKTERGINPYLLQLTHYELRWLMKAL